MCDMIKYCFFDLDGTLTDSAEGITKCVAHAIYSLDGSIHDPKEFMSFIGPPLHDKFMEYFGVTSEQADFMLIKYRERFVEKGMYENSVYDGVYEMLEQLKSKGYILSLATSKPECHSVTILKHFSLFDYFDETVGSELDGSRISKIDVIKEALKRLEITDYSEVIMVGDRKHDICTAKELGIKSIGVTYGFAPEGELEEAGADFIVGTPYEVAEIIEGLRNNEA